MPNHIKSLQSLRFIFIYLILLSHFSWDSIGPFDFGGDCGVAFFFMLSGFVLAYGQSSKKDTIPSFSIKFIKERLYKIYPLHLFCLLATLVICPWVLNSYIKILPSIFLIQSWFPDKEIYFGGNGVAWFLSDIILFYILFNSIYKFIFSINYKKLFILLSLLFIGYLYFISIVPNEKINFLIYVFPAIRFIDFLFGIILCRLYLHINNKIVISSKPKTSTIIEIIAFIFFSLTIILYPKIPYRIATVSLFWIPSAILILVFSLLDSNPGYIGKLLHSRFLLILGSISFEIFLIHTILISLLSRINSKLELNISYPIGLILLTLLVLICAYIIHNFKKFPLYRKYSTH